jgi:hypothetical protein
MAKKDFNEFAVYFKAAEGVLMGVRSYHKQDGTYVPYINDWTEQRFDVLILVCVDDKLYRYGSDPKADVGFPSLPRLAAKFFEYWSKKNEEAYTEEQSSEIVGEIRFLQGHYISAVNTDSCTVLEDTLAAFAGNYIGVGVH